MDTSTASAESAEQPRARSLNDRQLTTGRRLPRTPADTRRRSTRRSDLRPLVPGEGADDDPDLVDPRRVREEQQLRSSLPMPLWPKEHTYLPDSLIAPVRFSSWRSNATCISAECCSQLQPTHYRVTINNKPGWFAQCGFEALAIRWLLPGQQVRIDAPCLCCGDPISIVMQNEEISLVEPAEAVGYTMSEVGGDAASRPFR